MVAGETAFALFTVLLAITIAATIHHYQHMSKRKDGRSHKKSFTMLWNKIPSGPLISPANALTKEQSQKYHKRMVIQKHVAPIAAANRLMVNCREGACAQIPLTLENPQKYCSWAGRHNNNKHKGVENPEFSIGSVWTVNSDNNQFLIEYAQRDEHGNYLQNPNKNSLENVGIRIVSPNSQSSDIDMELNDNNNHNINTRNNSLNDSDNNTNDNVSSIQVLTQEIRSFKNSVTKQMKVLSKSNSNQNKNDKKQSKLTDSLQKIANKVVKVTNKVKIKSLTLKEFVEEEGRKHLIPVWDVKTQQWLIFCIACLGSCATFTTKNDFADGISVGDDDYKSKKFFRLFKKRINNHLNESPRNHESALQIVEQNRSKEMASILNKADMVYSIIKRGWSDSDFQELIRLQINDKMRSGCNNTSCNQIGDYGHTSKQVKQFVKLYKLVIKDEIVEVMLPSAVCFRNYVFVSGSMDGVTFSPNKYDACVAILKVQQQVKAIPTGLKEFQYNDTDKKIKNTKASVEAYKESLIEWGLLPSDIKDDNELSLPNEKPFIILRNFALDGVYMHEQNENGDTIINDHIQDTFVITPFWESTIHDLMHSRQLAAKKALQDCPRMNEIKTHHSNIINTFRDSKWTTKARNIYKSIKDGAWVVCIYLPIIFLVWILLSPTRWMLHYFKSTKRILENFYLGYLLCRAIANTDQSIARTSQQWRQFYCSILNPVHCIMVTDFGTNISIV